jgi:hypothetical protein
MLKTWCFKELQIAGMGFVLLAAINVMIILFWDVMSCSLPNEHLKFICLITEVKMRVINRRVYVNQKGKIL